jgi:Smg protein
MLFCLKQAVADCVPMLEVLVYVFEKHLRLHEALCFERDTLTSDLIKAGFEDEQIFDALAWLDALKQGQLGLTRLSPCTDAATRLYQPDEREKLGDDNINLLIQMKNNHILDASTHELVVDRLMALPDRHLASYQVKCVALLVLFAEPGGEQALAAMEYCVMKDSEEVVLH